MSRYKNELQQKQSSPNTHLIKQQFSPYERNLQTPRSHSSKNYQNKSMVQSMFYSTISNHAQQCLCKQCLCGRHLCKFDSPAPAMSFGTTYSRHYPPRQPSRYKPSHGRPNSAKTLQSPLLTFSSTYRDSFYKGNADQLSRPKPKDQLSCNDCPAMQLTSYGQQFPGHKGKNQYVPVNPQLFRGGLPFNCSTTYQKQYSKQKGKSADKAKPPDQFNMSGSWLGESSYRNQYQNPKNHVSTQKKKSKENNGDINNLSKNSNDPQQKRSPSTHFKTTYNNDFIKLSPAVCPAAKVIQGQNLSKTNFKQNSNFKGMDNSYLSIAKNGSSFC